MEDCKKCEKCAKLESENKRLHIAMEALKEDRDYYRDAYHHLLNVGKDNAKATEV